MRYIVFCYKLPFSLEKFKVGSHKMFMQAMKFYSQKPTEDNNYEFIATVKPSSMLQSKFVKCIIPKNCDNVQQHSQLMWPVSRTQFTVPNRPSIGQALMITVAVSDKLTNLPVEIQQVIQNNKCQKQYYDLVPTNFKDQTCVVYSLIQFEVNYFAKTIIQNAITTAITQIELKNYEYIIKASNEWENDTVQ
ncbi:Phosphatidylinositol_transfer protein [Hexamita inflata]|uniref:Phosphatidylinositol transfer protein n=1 Tax=Hexamita inflata TaxID=28002 RepID=A0AA86UAT1_9EUKA|nr:Phosphatidylinositol transfer protein [Hexamita inflata]